METAVSARPHSWSFAGDPTVLRPSLSSTSLSNTLLRSAPAGTPDNRVGSMHMRRTRLAQAEPRNYIGPTCNTQVLSPGPAWCVCPLVEHVVGVFTVFVLDFRKASRPRQPCLAPPAEIFWPSPVRVASPDDSRRCGANRLHVGRRVRVTVGRPAVSDGADGEGGDHEAVISASNSLRVSYSSPMTRSANVSSNQRSLCGDSPAFGRTISGHHPLHPILSGAA